MIYHDVKIVLKMVGFPQIRIGKICLEVSLLCVCGETHGKIQCLLVLKFGRLRMLPHLRLVGGIPTPLKNISQSGWLFPVYGNIKVMFQTTNQPSKLLHCITSTVINCHLAGSFCSFRMDPSVTSLARHLPILLRPSKWGNSSSWTYLTYWF